MGGYSGRGASWPGSSVHAIHQGPSHEPFASRRGMGGPAPGGPGQMPPARLRSLARPERRRPLRPRAITLSPIDPLPENHHGTFEVDCRSSNYLVSCDSRTAVIDKTMRFYVHKAGFELNLIRLNNESYLSTLRNKLLWGIDARNY